MPRIPTQRRQILPSGQVPSVPIPADTFAAEIRARDISGGLQQVAGIAAGVAQKLDNIEVNTQVSQVEGFINTKRVEMRDFAADNLDHTLYQDKWKELQVEIDSVAGQVKNPRARRNVQNFITKNKALWQDSVNGFENRGRITAGQLELDNAINRIIVGDVSQDAAILGMTAEDVKSSAIENHIQAAIDNDLITAEQGDKLRLASDAAVKKFETEQMKATVSEGAFDAWKGTVSEASPDGDLRVAFDFVQASDVPDKQEIESEVRTRVVNRRAENKIALENQQETDRGIINDALYVNKDYSNSLELIRNSTLPEKEKTALFKENEDRAKLAARGEVEVNDPDALDKVTTAIAQLGNDTLPLADAKKIFKENSRFLKGTTADSLWKELIGEFDTSVDTAAARVRGDIRLRAVGRTESALDRLLEALAGAPAKDQPALEDRIATAREKFNLELSNFNRWEETQRAWRRTNNNATPEQIQQEGMRSWFTEFAGKDIEELRKDVARQVQLLTALPGKDEQEFRVAYAKIARENNLNPDPDDLQHFYDYRGLFDETGKLKVGPQKHFPSKFKLLGHPNLIVSNKDTRTGEQATPELIVANKEANKKVKSLLKPLPALRIRMVSPDGRTGTIPEDKVEEAIKQGWKKL